MAQKKSKEQAAEKQVTSSILESARQIWLAGLGAFAKAEEEGNRFFEALVKEGEQMETRTRKMATDKVEEVRGRVEEVRGRATDTWDGLEQVFEDRVARVLNRLGVPTNEDIQELAKRVEELNENVKALNKQQ